MIYSRRHRGRLLCCIFLRSGDISVELTSRSHKEVQFSFKNESILKLDVTLSGGKQSQVLDLFNVHVIFGKVS